MKPYEDMDWPNKTAQFLRLIFEVILLVEIIQQDLFLECELGYFPICCQSNNSLCLLSTTDVVCVIEEMLNFLFLQNEARKPEQGWP